MPTHKLFITNHITPNCVNKLSTRSLVSHHHLPFAHYVSFGPHAQPSSKLRLGASNGSPCTTKSTHPIAKMKEKEKEKEKEKKKEFCVGNEQRQREGKSE